MNDIKVSISCLVYNHEDYLRRCLDGFVNQKCNFKYEVLIHDDASTDSSADIIREYEEKYPDIIKPIYQTENQYSKGIGISSTYQYPRAKGEYMAWCEGDDCWTDPLKLQKQVDFMDDNPDFSMCTHRVRYINLRTGENINLPKIKKNREWKCEEVIKGGAVFHVSAIMMRTRLLMEKPSCFVAKGFGDIQLYIYSALCGRIMVLSDVMSIHNHGVQGSWTIRVGENTIKRIEHAEERLKMLEQTNKYYEFKYNDSFDYSIRQAKFEIAYLKNEKKEYKKKEFRIFLRLQRKRNIKVFIKKHFSWVIRLLGRNKSHCQKENV